jgi:hypothetical protein
MHKTKEQFRLNFKQFLFDIAHCGTGVSYGEAEGGDPHLAAGTLQQQKH